MSVAMNSTLDIKLDLNLPTGDKNVLTYHTRAPSPAAAAEQYQAVSQVFTSLLS